MARGKRKKKVKGGDLPVVSEDKDKNTPRCLVLSIGEVGSRVKDLVADFRKVMMPNTANKLKEAKTNRIEDYMAVAGNLGISHLIVFKGSKIGTYMKLAKLPAGPTLTFRLLHYSRIADVLASQKRPLGPGPKDHITAPLQVLNGFGAASAGSLDPAQRELMAEMLRGMFPAIDVPTFDWEGECKRTALFHRDGETESVHFRHFRVSKEKQLVQGMDKGLKRLFKANNINRIKASKLSDIADMVKGGGGGGSDSEGEDPAQEVVSSGRGQVAVKLAELGPRMELLLIKTEEGVCNGTVLYHRYMSQKPSQQDVVEAKAKQRRKLKERNAGIEAQMKVLKPTKKERDRQRALDRKASSGKGKGKGKGKDKGDDGEDEVAEEDLDKAEAAGGGGGKKKQAGGQGSDKVESKGADAKQKKFHPLGYGKKAKPDKSGTVEIGGRGKKGGKGGKGKGGGGKGGSRGSEPRMSVMDKFKQRGPR